MNRPGKLTAVISSTAIDLPDHRKQVVDACLRSGIFPIGMEQLPARDASAIQVSLELVDQADIYIGIYAWRYGWVPEFDNPKQISITEMEYNRALERTHSGELKEVLIFVMHDDHPTIGHGVETDATIRDKLKKLKERASARRVRVEFKSPEDLRGHVIQSLEGVKRRIESAQAATPHFHDFHPPRLIPEPPAPYVAHPYSLLQTKDLIGRQAELDLLTDWATTNKQIPVDTHIVNVVAIGGMGKSALTWKWFNDIAPNELPTATARLWWSFYESDAHWENFIIRALAYASGQPEKAVREMRSCEREDQLLSILDHRPFLLVLDGLERILLAYARLDAAQMLDEDFDEETVNRVAQGHRQPEVSSGEQFTIKHQLRRTTDRRAGQFLRKLRNVRQSRTLITTRLYPAELQTDTGETLPGCFALCLKGLSDHDALTLWRAYDVTGSASTLLPLFNAFDNYPLLLRALAGEVSGFRPAPGNFDKWQTAHPGFNPAGLRLDNARTHVLTFALRGLSKVQRRVLQLIAAFRMPATWETLQELIVRGSQREDTQSSDPASPPTKWETAHADWSENGLCRNEQHLDVVLTDLEDRGLVGWDKHANRYDLHPIIRGVVWATLDSGTKRAIFDQLRAYFSSCPQPDDWRKVEHFEDLTASVELYCSLIGLKRFDEACSAFQELLNQATLRRLGTSRQRAELLEGLFPDGLDTIPQLSSLEDQGFALNALAQAFQLTGEPNRSIPLFRKCYEVDVQAHEPGDAAVDLCNLTYALLMVGKLREAEIIARKAMSMCRCEHSAFNEAVSLFWIGLGYAARWDAVKSALCFARAHRIFASEEKPQASGHVYSHLAQRGIWMRAPKEALLYSQRAWDLAETERREGDFIRAARLQGEANLAIGNLETADERLHHALHRARSVNLIDEELPSLVSLAAYHRLIGTNEDFAAARELLEQVYAPAERGPFPLIHADAINVLAGIERDQGNREAAIAAAAQSYRLAWCDGPPYAYCCGLINAQDYLQELEAPEPDLQPFDESQFEPMPDVDLNPKDEFWVDPDKLGLQNSTCSRTCFPPATADDAENSSEEQA